MPIDKAGPNYEPWLERWLPLLKTSAETPILDLGCGAGFDSRYIIKQGLSVIAADHARNALGVVRQVAGEIPLALIDLRQGLPFQKEAFQIIVANLSLHYFPWEHTQSLIAMVHDNLKEGGCLLARVNSTHDKNYGARGHLRLAPNYFLVEGEPKRFFSRQDVERLFKTGWSTHGIEEMMIHCYNKPKVVWEVVVTKEQPR
jgi:SAM-dependent methyltransferase